MPLKLKHCHFYHGSLVLEGLVYKSTMFKKNLNLHSKLVTFFISGKMSVRPCSFILFNLGVNNEKKKPVSCLKHILALFSTLN